MTTRGAKPRAIVYVGPSISLGLATQILPKTEYRPPIRRGDLDDLGPGSVVGIIDGVFDEAAAIGVGEIRRALARGLVVFGAATLGAVRAAEVPGMIGIGRIYEQYRTGAIAGLAEVAVASHPRTGAALTEPLVNVRYALERLVRSGTLSREDGDALLRAAIDIPHNERTYQEVLHRSSLRDNPDGGAIVQLLENFDLKRDDAQLLLETLARMHSDDDLRLITARLQHGPTPRVREQEDVLAPIMIWEYGDVVLFEELLQFLKLTGAFEPVARAALGRFTSAGVELESAAPAPSDDVSDSQWLLDCNRMVWGWRTAEDAHVTMRDLGLGLDDVQRSLEAESTARRRTTSTAALPSMEFLKALRCELWMHDLALKRETLRYGSLQYFARLGERLGPLQESEIVDAQRTTCRLQGVMKWEEAVSALGDLAVSLRDLEPLLGKVALARRAYRARLEFDGRSACAPRGASAAEHWRALGLPVEPSPKAAGSARFSLPLSAAVEAAERVAENMALKWVRLLGGRIDELGVQVAQAFGDRSGWSCSFSSGKAVTPEGAKIGSIMEEAEIRAQNRFQPQPAAHVSFAESHTKLSVTNPRDLDLPYDTGYTEDLALDWVECFDLIGCRKRLIPLARVVTQRVVNDICYSLRYGAKCISTNGLGSGFTLAEAIVHAASECIERHAVRLAEFELSNPGGLPRQPAFRFVDETTLPEAPRRIVDGYKRAGKCVRMLDITSEIAVPAFAVQLFEDPFTAPRSIASDGSAAHPDPEVAMVSALLEAAQARAASIPTGREGHAVKARSLGRHERPRTVRRDAQLLWFANDPPTHAFEHCKGFRSQDIAAELEWLVERVRRAGFQEFLVLDYTTDAIAPAYAVRVVIPGLESINPFYVGPRARAASIRDLLPERGRPV